MSCSVWYSCLVAPSLHAQPRFQFIHSRCLCIIVCACILFSQTPGVDLHTKVVNIPETNDSVVRFCASKIVIHRWWVQLCCDSFDDSGTFLQEFYLYDSGGQEIFADLVQQSVSEHLDIRYFAICKAILISGEVGQTQW